VIYGSRRSELILATNDSDIIYGYGGNDEIRGYDEADDIYGGSGNDLIYGGAGIDNIYGGSGVNDLFGGNGVDRFVMSNRGTSASDDWIGDFTLDVDRINVRAWGISDFSQIKELLHTDGRGDTWFNARYDGFDHFITIDRVSRNQLIPSDFIYSNAGAKTEVGTDNADTLFGSQGNDTLNGLDGKDILLGGEGNDDLLGGAGADEIIGGKGNDQITGAKGQDTLSGDAGEDIFVFKKVAHSLAGGSRDLIEDFVRGKDVIDVSAIDANDTASGNQDFDWIETADFTAAGQLRYRYSGGMTIISGNTDGDGDAEFQLALEGRINLGAGDFVL
jgi:Ca2+-binding RTX toxin-like protein